MLKSKQKKIMTGLILAICVVCILIRVFPVIICALLIFTTIMYVKKYIDTHADDMMHDPIDRPTPITKKKRTEIINGDEL
jgi:hypothetical protein